MKTQIIKTYQASETTHRIQLAEINIRIEGISGSKDIDKLIKLLRDLQEEVQEESFFHLVKQVDQEIENLLVNLHKGSVFGVPHVPEYKPNSQKANSDTISVGKTKVTVNQKRTAFPKPVVIYADTEFPVFGLSLREQLCQTKTTP